MSYKDYYFERNADDKKPQTLFDERNRRLAVDLRKALKANKADNIVVEKVKSMIGKGAPSSAPVSCNILLCDYGRDRLNDGIERFVTANSQLHGELRAYMVEPTEKGPGDFDLKHARSLVQPTLKREFRHFVARFRVARVGDLPSMALFVIGLREENFAQASPQRRRQVECADARSKIRLTNTNDFELAAAAFWETDARIWQAMDAADEETGSDSQISLDCFMIQARLNIAKSMFGFGFGKKLAASMSKEIRARAASLDLVGLSPVQPQSVASALSTIPADGLGAHYQLASIKHL